MQITRNRPFRGSSALATGALTRGVLYGPGYRRLYPDIHIDADAQLDLETWSRAAHELVAPCGVLAGYSAAELHGASCAPPNAPAELLPLDGYRRRAGPMLVVRLDALSFTCEFDPAVIIDAVPPGARGSARVPGVLTLADRLAQSPMETRIRLAIILEGLPPPVSQHPVVVGGHEFALDLAYPDVQLAIEYNGSDHLRPDRALRDLEREQLLVAAGWRIVRFGAVTALYYPRTIAARVRQELRARGVRT